MTQKGLDLIKEFEGFRGEAYLCPAKLPTIGYGATFYMDGSKVKLGDKITKEDAEILLNNMSEKCFGEYVDKYVTSKINPYQRDALISFAYNCGNGSLKSSTLLKKVNANPSDASIRNEFMKWTKGGGKELPGLVRRRKAESDLYFEEWVEPVTEPEPEPEKKELHFSGQLISK